MYYAAAGTVPAGEYTVEVLSATDANGCYSVVTLNLTVSDSDTTNLDEVVCFGGSYTVGSSVYTSTGVHSTTLTGNLGCDSVVILNLTVLPQATSVVSDTICSSSAGVVIGTQTFSLAGSYTVTLAGAGAAGCDSVVTLNLVVNPPLSLEFSLKSECGNASSSQQYFRAWPPGCLPKYSICIGRNDHNSRKPPWYLPEPG